MRNRAKCKLCNSIIESFHKYDLVECKCGEISIDGGLELLNCAAKHWENFLRIDENGKEIPIKVEDATDKNEEIPEPKAVLTRDEQIEMLDGMIKNIENLPQQAMSLPINHYDFYSFM